MNEPTIGFLDANFDDVYDFELLAADTEVQVRCSKAEMHRSPAGNISLHLTLEVADNPAVDDMHVYASIPTPELKSQDPKKYNKGLIGLKRVYDAFQIDTARPQIDVAEFEGQSAWAVIGIEEGVDGFEPRNKITKWVASA